MATALDLDIWTQADRIDSSVSPVLKKEEELIEHMESILSITEETVKRTGSCAEGTKVNSKYDQGDLDALFLSNKVVLDESLFQYISEDPAYFKIVATGEHRAFFEDEDTSNGYVLADTLRTMNERHFYLHRLIVELMAVPNKSRKGFTYGHATNVGLEKRIVVQEQGTTRDSFDVDNHEFLHFDRAEACRFLLEKFGELLTKSRDGDYTVLGDFVSTNMRWVKKYCEVASENILQGSVKDAVLQQSADFVPAYKIKSGSWPRVAEEWKSRDRKWPSQKIVDAVVSEGCHVIAKPPPYLLADGRILDHEQDVYFRLSFATSEVILAESMTDIQRTCWKIVKAYQKGFLETQTKVLTSYHWKNIVFWLCEEQSGSFWAKENLLTCVICCIDKMIKCLECKNLPQYFCPSMNLLNHCDEATMEMVHGKLKNIQNDPVSYLRFFLDNPPKAKLCDVDSKEMQAGTLNKLVETGHKSLCGIVTDMSRLRTNAEVGQFNKRAADGCVNILSDILTDISKTEEQKELVQSTVQSTRNFVSRAFDPLVNGEIGDDHIPAHFKKEAKRLGKEIGKTLLTALTSSTDDIDLD